MSPDRAASIVAMRRNGGLTRETTRMQLQRLEEKLAKFSILVTYLDEGSWQETAKHGGSLTLQRARKIVRQDRMLPGARHAVLLEPITNRWINRHVTGDVALPAPMAGIDRNLSFLPLTAASAAVVADVPLIGDLVMNESALMPRQTRRPLTACPMRSPDLTLFDQAGLWALSGCHGQMLSCRQA